MTMQIEMTQVMVRSLVEDYIEGGEDIGVTGYGGMVNIRPPYQRDFVYNDKQQQEVIRTIKQGYPLGVMYWCETADGDYEVLDGQQRAISICRYVRGDYSVDGRPFHSLPLDKQEEILGYSLQVYMCKGGTDSEKIAWFEKINIAGAQLTRQELRNAVFHGPMVSEARRWFSKTGGPSTAVGGAYIKGTANRQEHLETAIKWINDDDVDGWMARFCREENAAAGLWTHFNAVIEWVKGVFPMYRKEMKGIDWGALYRDHAHREDLDPTVLENEIREMMANEDIKRKAGIYQYVLDRNERHLSLRSFSEAQRRTAYERQGGKCGLSGEHLSIEDMDAHHIKPFSLGGRTTDDNCMMVGKQAHRNHHAQGSA